MKVFLKSVMQLWMCDTYSIIIGDDGKEDHLFSFRTQKLSSFTLKVLGWKRPGRIRSCRFSIKGLTTVSPFLLPFQYFNQHIYLYLLLYAVLVISISLFLYPISNYLAWLRLFYRANIISYAVWLFKEYLTFRLNIF